MSLNPEQIKNIIEAALMAAGQPLSIDRLLTLFLDEAQPSRDEIRASLEALAEECAQRGIELKEVGSGFRYQAKQDYAEWVARLWEEKPPRYSRALLETLALIAYRQPITRGEIEDIRGVSVSSNIIKTLLERDWVKVVGHRDVPGKPAMYATTKQFLDYFSLKSLSELPTLAEIRDIDSINAELALNEPGVEPTAQGEGEVTGAAESAAEAEVEDIMEDSASQEEAMAVEEVMEDSAAEEEAVVAEAVTEDSVSDEETVVAGEVASGEKGIELAAEEDMPPIEESSEQQAASVADPA
jgi:segregation and condensation protein B